MAKQVWKYTLDSMTTNVISMPLGARIISVDSQREEICIWVLVDTDEKKTMIHRFVVCPTGGDIPETVEYFLGTAQLQNGALVFHVFQLNGDVVA